MIVIYMMNYFFMLMLVGIGNPLGTRNSHEYEFEQNFIPVIGMSFLTGAFFLREYEFRHWLSWADAADRPLSPISSAAAHRRALADHGAIVFSSGGDTAQQHTRWLGWPNVAACLSDRLAAARQPDDGAAQPIASPLQRIQSCCAPRRR
jgi:hypothetical protein